MNNNDEKYSEIVNASQELGIVKQVSELNNITPTFFSHFFNFHSKRIPFPFKIARKYIQD